MIKFLPEDIETEDLLNNLRTMGREITSLLKSYSQNNLDTKEFKKKLRIKNLPSGPVTSADIEVNEIIRKVIKDNYPSQPWEILSEENKINPTISSDWVWIIDPLDGTKDLIQNTGEYAVHMALTYRKKVVISIVLIPSRDEIWFYQEGKGTWCESLDGQNRSLANTNSKSIEEITIVTSRNHFHPELAEGLKKLSPSKVLGMGSIGYKITAILRGEADLYITYSGPKESSPKDWDFAAPFALLKGNGGKITHLDCSEISFLKCKNYEQKGFIIASINNNHKDICKKLTNAFKTSF